MHHYGYQYMIPKLPHLIKFIETVFTFDNDIFMIVHNINNNKFSFTLNQITFCIYIKFKVHQFNSHLPPTSEDGVQSQDHESRLLGQQLLRLKQLLQLYMVLVELHTSREASPDPDDETLVLVSSFVAFSLYEYIPVNIPLCMHTLAYKYTWTWKKYRSGFIFKGIFLSFYLSLCL